MDDPICARIHAGVHHLFPDRVEKIVLYGSRARGEAVPSSDYDVAVFLHDYRGRLKEVDRLADLSWEIQKTTGAIVSALPFSVRDFADDTLLMENIRRDGVSL